MTPPPNTLRLDRWLFFSRFYKTRTLAKKAIDAGQVKRNGETASAKSKAQPDDVIDFTKDRLPYRIVILRLPTRRGPAKEAQACFDDDAEVAKSRQALINQLRRDRLQMPTTRGRPDKHTQRLLRSRSRNSSD